MGDVVSNPIISLQPNLGAPQVIYLADGRAFFVCIGNPNGIIAANIGSIAIDKQTGISYKKITESTFANPVNTGWIPEDGAFLQRSFAAATGFANSGGAETTVGSITIPANTLSANNDAFEFTVAGETAANANLKQMRFYFPTATIYFDTGPLAFNNRDWICTFTIARTAPTTARAYGSFTCESSGGVPFFQNTINNPITGLDFTIDNQVRITAQGVASNDVLLTCLEAFLKKTSTFWAP